MAQVFSQYFFGDLCFLTPEMRGDKRARQRFVEKTLSDHLKQEIKIEYDHNGRPWCQDGRSISISHKNEKLLVIIATKPNVHLGCDLECLEQEIAWPLFDKHFYSENELKALDLNEDPSLDHSKRLALFSIKEAIFKCSGSKSEVLLKSWSSDRVIWYCPTLNFQSLYSQLQGLWVQSFAVQIKENS